MKQEHHLWAASGWWAGFRVLQRRQPRALVASNALTSFGGGMQLLLQGWMVIAWGHNPLLLAAFAACRLAPKVLFTFPAGILSDRVPRSRIMLASRCLNVVASLLPLVGFLAPWPFAWLFVAAALAGTIHAFDLPAGRAMLADVVPPRDLDATVALSGAGSHLAGLIGPAVAFLMVEGPGRPAAFGVSAAVLAIASIITGTLPSVTPTASHTRGAIAVKELVRYLLATPAVGLLLLAEMIPSVISKAFVLILPSLAHGGGGTVSLTLVSTEVGALAAAGLLAMAPIRLGYKGLCVLAGAYGSLIFTASFESRGAEQLIVVLGLAGMAKLALSTGALARVQEIVPSHMRGRVLAV